MTPRNTLVLPENSHVALFSANGEELNSAIRVPRWLTSSLDIDHQFPTPAKRLKESTSLEPLIHMAEEIRHTRKPIKEHLLQFKRDGQNLTVLASGHWSEDLPELQHEPGVMIFMRDVTEVIKQRQKAAAIGAFHGLIGSSIPMLELYQKISIYGPTEAPVLITGETGTGKELIARAIHERSERQSEAFVAVNCSALTSELFESELFGHEKGSFTGAYRQHRGRFERADKGTLFLDEIGDMPAMSQAKMLRTLEEGIIERVGGEQEREVDVRVVAATNVGLEDAVRQNRFRSDLYHRLSVLRLHVPPLRSRKEDIPLLVDHFLHLFNRRYKRSIRKLTPEALRVLKDYYWPGNIRELRNVMERLVIETQGEAISAKALSQWMYEREYLAPGSWGVDEVVYQPGTYYTSGHQTSADRGELHVWKSESPHQEILALPISDDVVETEILQDSVEEKASSLEMTEENIQQAYRQARGNLTKAARIMGVHKATLYRHMNRLGLSREMLDGGES